MRKKKNGGYALIEIILSIGVLAIVSMTVLQMFTLASDIQKRARDVDMAALEAQTEAEWFHVHGIYAGATYYDDNWNIIFDKVAAKYEMICEKRVEGGLEYLSITVRRSEENKPLTFGEKEENVKSPVLFKMESAVARGGAGG